MKLTIIICLLLVAAGCKTAEQPVPSVQDDPNWVEPGGEFPTWEPPPGGWTAEEPNPNAPSEEEEIDPDWDTENPALWEDEE